MRVKAEIWVKAYIRRCSVNGIYAIVMKRGDSDAGAIFIKINFLNGFARLLGPAPAGFETGDVERMWIFQFGDDEKTEEAIDTYLERQRREDPDIWIVEVEDRNGRHFLEEDIMKM